MCHVSRNRCGTQQLTFRVPWESQCRNTQLLLQQGTLGGPSYLGERNVNFGEFAD